MNPNSCPYPFAVEMKTEGGIRTGFREKVPCGRCNICRMKHRKMWAFRMTQELKTSVNAFFITLTYNEENAPRTPEGWTTLDKDHVKSFIKRIKQRQVRNTAEFTHPLRYLLVGEYGDLTLRAHYHAIIYNIHDSTLDDLHNIWGQGHVHLGTVSDKRIMYTTKYMMKDKDVRPDDSIPPFTLMSRKPFIGWNRINELGGKIDLIDYDQQYERNGNIYTRKAKKLQCTKVPQVHIDQEHERLYDKAIAIPRIYKKYYEQVLGKKSITTRILERDKRVEEYDKQWIDALEDKIRKGYKTDEAIRKLEEDHQLWEQQLVKKLTKTFI